jgi:hypothetical protein
MAAELPRVMLNPEDGSLYIQTGGPTVTVEGIRADVLLERMLPSGDSAAALWVSHAEADVLVKMVRHILDRVPIRPESRDLLQELLPRLESLYEQMTSSGG